MGVGAGPAPRRGGVGGAGEVVEVGAFGVVELQRPGQCVEDRVGDAAQVAALQPGVVVDTDPGERRDLLPAQPGDAALVAEGRQAGLGGGDAGRGG